MRLGLIRAQANDMNVQNIPVAERIVHPKYSSKTKYNDIALLKLTEKVKFTEYVRPACLNWDTSNKWTVALATGFGRLAFGNDVMQCYV